MGEREEEGSGESPEEALTNLRTKLRARRGDANGVNTGMPNEVVLPLFEACTGPEFDSVGDRFSPFGDLGHRWASGGW